MDWASRHIARGAMVAFLALGVAACGVSVAPTPGGQAKPAGAQARVRSAVSQCQTTTCIYVANTRLHRTSSIAVFPTTAQGNAAPVQLIEGESTGLIDATGVAVDAAYNIYVSNISNGSGSLSSVLIFPAGSTGNVAPTQSIAGSNTQLTFANALALDASGNIYVANEGISGAASSINVYAAGASGNVAPLRTITGPDTGVVDPDGIAVDSTGRVYCTNEFASSVTVYAAGASGDAVPIATIRGRLAKLNLPQGPTVDAAGKLYVADYRESTLTVYAAGATGNVKPIQRLVGSDTDLKKDKAVAVDAAANMYVTNFKTNLITVYAAGAHGDAVPIRKISGKMTNLLGPGGIALR